MVCQACGHEVSDDASFCPRCGAGLKGVKKQGAETPEGASGGTAEPPTSISTGQVAPTPPTAFDTRQTETTTSVPTPPAVSQPVRPCQVTIPGPIPYPQVLPRTDGMCVAAMILGIVGLVLIWVPFLAWILGLLGIVFGALGMKSVRDNPTGRSGYGMGLAGLILGTLSLVGGVGLFVVWVALTS